jgi:predicted alpha/beta superfamily hydrolase
MNTTTSAKRLEREIETIKQNLLALGSMHPGSVSRQYQVCGNPACRCMHPKTPQKHGPYYKLAYVHRGKPVCRFVRAACVDEMKTRLAAYKKFRSLIDKWVELSIQQGVSDFFTPTPKAKVAKSK